MITRFMVANPSVLVKWEDRQFQCSHVTSTDTPIFNLMGYFGVEKIEA